MQVQGSNDTLFEAKEGLPQIAKPKREEIKKKVEEEVYKEQIKKKINEQSKFDQLAKKAPRVIYQLESVWPFEFFPSRIVIQEDAVNIIDKFFFRSAQMTATPYTRLLNATVTTSLLFAEINLEFEGFPMNKPFDPVRFLKRKEAIYAVRLINGLIVCAREQIELSSTDDLTSLRKKLEDIGSSHERGIGV